LLQGGEQRQPVVQFISCLPGLFACAFGGFARLLVRFLGGLKAEFGLARAVFRGPGFRAVSFAMVRAARNPADVVFRREEGVTALVFMAQALLVSCPSAMPAKWY
jgi:hypothetical protein